MTGASAPPIDPRPVAAHHDGSPLHVAPGPIRLGDRVPVRVRVPHHRSVDRVVVRSVADGEPHFERARLDRADDDQTWWVAEVPVDDVVTGYRFLLERDTRAGLRARWLNAAGIQRHDVTDAADFRVSTHAPPPAWLEGAVAYHVFLDRFARGSRWRDRPPAPDWAHPARWDDQVEPHGPDAVRQWYGGDLHGVREHLDHVQRLGASVLILTPFFPARSSHRYDATTFDSVDPLLGGDAALTALCEEAHRRGLRVIGDLTLHHTGSGHEWFERAQARRESPEAGFYHFVTHPQEYASWYGVPSLPKLDHRSPELRRRLVAGVDSVVARWLRPPFGLDGWRIDCGQAAGRHGASDHNLELARVVRATMRAVRADSWLLAEHPYDAVRELGTGGWDGVTAYRWFTRPITQWLAATEPVMTMSAWPLPRLDGAGTVVSMRNFAAGVPWSGLIASANMLDSHDTARIRSVVGGDRDAHLTALVALTTFPGVPTVFAGSEIGVTGDALDSARVPFPWDRPDRWDTELLEGTRAMLALRRAHPALRSGGLRWLTPGRDRVRYVRECADEQLVIELRRDGAPAGIGPEGAEPVVELGGATIWRR